MLAPDNIAWMRTTGWQARLRAWWHGTTVTSGSTRQAPASAQPAAPVVTPPPVFWSAERRFVAQTVWGRGHLDPPGEAGVGRWLMTVGFDSAMTVANLGVKLGGSTATLHRLFKVYPKSFEADPELAALAAEYAARLGLSRREAVQPFDPEEPQLKQGGFDRVVALEVMHGVAAKHEFLEGVCAALKPRGYLLLTGFALGEDADPGDPALEHWRAAEPGPRMLWPLSEMERELGRRNMQVHVAADESDILRAAITEAWARVSIDPARIRANPAIGVAMLAEAERWALCAAALDAGVLRHTRIIAAMA